VLQTRYCQSDQIGEYEMGGARGTHGEKINVYRLMLGKLEGKRQFARPTISWKSNFKMDLEEIGLQGVDWTYVAQARDKWQIQVSTATKLRAPCYVGIWVSKEYWAPRWLLHGVITVVS